MSVDIKKYCQPFVRALKELDTVCFALAEVDKPHYQAARAAIDAILEAHALEVRQESCRLRASCTTQR